MPALPATVIRFRQEARPSRGRDEIVKGTKLTGICLPDTFVWQTRGDSPKVATRCSACEGSGSKEKRGGKKTVCPKCEGGGWHGIDPSEPTDCFPAEEHDGEMVHARVAVYQVRYAAGYQIWNPDDLNIRPFLKTNPDRTYPRRHHNHWSNE